MTAPSEEPLVCRCFRISGDKIRKAIKEKELKLVEEVTALTRAGMGCSSCWDDIQEILNGIWGKPPARPAKGKPGLSRTKKRKIVRTLIEEEMDSLFRVNGLVCQLVEVGDDRVLARFTGPTVGTPAPSFLSIKRHLVERMIDLCGRKMQLVEINVLEAQAREQRP